MRVAIVTQLESIPWVPIVAGLLEGFRGLEDVEACQGFPMTDKPWLHLVELRSFAPDLVLFPCSFHAWKHAGPYVQLAKELGARTAALTFDDPYDMFTGLEMGKALGFVFTPELLAVDVYEREGIAARHLLPTVSTRLHYPPIFSQRHGYAKGEYGLDVFQVGGNRWTPRRRYLPAIRQWCQQNSKRYGEFAGNRRWIVGEELTRAIHSSRTVLEIPRFDLPTRTNPHQVVCTYTGPRVYLVAACGGLPVVIGPRQDLGDVFPEAPRAGDLAEAYELLAFWTDPAMDARRRSVGEKLRARFLEHHRPELRAGQILRQMDLGTGNPGPGAGFPGNWSRVRAATGFAGPLESPTT